MGIINPTIVPVPVIENEREIEDETPVEKKVGPLTLAERWKKVQRYREKRKTRRWDCQTAYAGRKRVAGQRIRIKGRFVTPSQALKTMGTSYDVIRELIEGRGTDLTESIVKSLKIVDVNSLVAQQRYLGDAKNSSKSTETDTKPAAAVLVEALPTVDAPVFYVRRARQRETPAAHIKHHNKSTKTRLA